MATKKSAVLNAEADAGGGSWPVALIVLHWAIGAVVIFMIGLGWWLHANDIRPGQDAPAELIARLRFLIDLHKSLGFTVLGLMLTRGAVRFSTVRPPLRAPRGSALALLANASHAAFYVLLIAMPLSGWLMTSAFGTPFNNPTTYFELFQVPSLIPPNRAAFVFWHGVHGFIGYTIAGLVAVHTLAALKHAIIEKDDTLARMFGVSRKP